MKSVFTSKPVFVHSILPRVCRTNQNLTIFCDFGKSNYTVLEGQKHFFQGFSGVIVTFFRQLNLTIIGSEVKFSMFNFWG